jgi:hypothetical protein
MTQRRHPIARYHYAVDVSAGGAARLTLWDAAGNQIGDIGCLQDGVLLPAPRISADLSSVAAFVHVAGMPALLDLLRNERGAVLLIDDAPPGFISLESQSDAPASAPLAMKL